MPLIREYARELLDAAPDAMVIADSRGTIIYANHHTDVLFGYQPGELIGKQIEMLLPERYRVTHPSLRAAFAHDPRLRPMGENRELYAQHRNGSEFRVGISLSALQTDLGLLTSSTIRDITARADLPLQTSLLSQNDPATEERPGKSDELSEARERAQGTLHSIGDAVISTDPAGNVSYLNPIAEKMTGWSRADATGRPLQEVLTIVDDVVLEPILAPLLSAMQAIDVSSHGVLTRRDGSELAIEHSAAPMVNSRGATIGAVTVFRDESIARAVTQKLAYAALHDALTGLPNRMLYVTRLTQALALARRHSHAVGVLFLDLDGFKLVNDTLGHPVGDRLLESVARVLQRCVRSTDTVSRFGGDEFVVLLSEIARPEDAVVCAEKIIDALRMPHTIDEHSLLVTASIGIGVYPHDGIDPETLLRNADDAMFQAKRPGGNAYQMWSRQMGDEDAKLETTITKISERIVAPTIYVVDDNAGMRRALNVLLSAVGHATAAFSGPKEFLKDFNSESTGCVVLDMRMPDMSGLEVQQELNRLGAMIPVIFMTGHGDVPMAVQAMKEGAFDFVEKPFQDQALLERISQALQLDTDNRGRLALLGGVRRRFESLTPREREVNEKVVAGCANKVIAIDLGLSERTVEIHRSKVMEKMGARSVAHLVRLNMSLGEDH